jgi:hypothetical protein
MTSKPLNNMPNNVRKSTFVEIITKTKPLKSLKMKKRLCTPSIKCGEN